MKILFLGYAVCKDIAGTLSGASVAGNKMQVNVLDCLSEYDDVELDVLSIYPVSVFPREKRAHIKKEKINITDKVSALKIPFLNLPVIKQFSQTFSMYRQAKKYVKKNRNAIIFSFNLFPQVGLPLVWLKKRYGVKTVSLVADLPIDDKVGRKGLSKLFRSLFEKLTIYAQERCDHLVLLNRHVADYYNITDSYIIVEGGIDPDDVDNNSEHIYAPKKKNAVYSGALTQYSGIENLINAMKLVENREVTLDIYGDGYLHDFVESEAQNSENITYHGRVENAEMVQLQKDAWLLINPRVIDDYISKVTFPSKIFEYMLSETPVLTTRLNGFDKGYDSHLFFVGSDSPSDMAKSIDDIASMSYEQLKDFGEKSRAFVLKNKLWSVQCSRIHDFFVRINSED